MNNGCQVVVGWTRRIADLVAGHACRPCLQEAGRTQIGDGCRDTISRWARSGWHVGRFREHRLSSHQGIWRQRVGDWRIRGRRRRRRRHRRRWPWRSRWHVRWRYRRAWRRGRCRRHRRRRRRDRWSRWHRSLHHLFGVPGRLYQQPALSEPERALWDVADGVQQLVQLHVWAVPDRVHPDLHPVRPGPGARLWDLQDDRKFRDLHSPLLGLPQRHVTSTRVSLRRASGRSAGGQGR